MNILQYCIPPFIGAVIGLFTNWLAIKMIFRPLAERRIVGMRVPFTPGILPRERRRIAETLGNTVAHELLDEHTVSARLRSESCTNGLSFGIRRFMRNGLAATPRELRGAAAAPLVKACAAMAMEAGKTIAGSDAFKHTVQSAVRSIADEAETLTKSPQPLRAIFPKLSAYLAAYITTALREGARSGKSFSNYIDEDTIMSAFHRVFDGAYPQLVRELDGILHEAAIVRAMEKAGAQVIEKALSRLNTMQRLFVGIGGYNKTALEAIPEIISDFRSSLIDMLRQETIQALVKQRIETFARAYIQKPLSEYKYICDEEYMNALESAVTKLVSKALSSVSTETAVRAAGTAFADEADTVAAALSDWLRDFFSRETVSSTDDKAWMRSFLGRLYKNFEARCADTPLSENLGISDDTIQSFSGLLAAAAADFAASNALDILASLDIQSMVSDKVNSLDMLAMEKMLLAIVSKELNAITLFGAVLGAVMGLAQTAYMIFFM